jgi:hypothetical protein
MGTGLRIVPLRGQIHCVYSCGELAEMATRNSNQATQALSNELATQSRGYTSPREVRRPTRGEHQSLPAQSPQEPRMRNSFPVSSERHSQALRDL